MIQESIQTPFSQKLICTHDKLSEEDHPKIPSFPDVNYRARLKSDRSPAGSDGVRQKGLGFNL
jgi:hypothetical protein